MFCCFKRKRKHTRDDFMADFSRLEAAISDLSVKVDALIAKATTPAPDEQPAVDGAVAAIEQIVAKIPE